MKHNKILALSHTSDFTGGAEAVLLNLILNTSDIYVWTVIVPKAHGGFYDRLLKLQNVNIEVIFTPWWCSGSSYGQKISKKIINESINKIKDLALENDILLTNSMVNPWLGYVAISTNMPHIWYVHEFGDIDHKLDFSLGYAESLKFISSSSTKIITVSEAVKNHISKQIDSKKIDIIPQAINLDLITQIANPHNLSRKESINILTFGAIKPSKGQNIVLEALNMLNKKGDSTHKFRYKIAGPVADSSYLHQLKEYISKNGLNKIVEIKEGFVDPIPECEWSDIIITPSLNEALGRTTIESVASGRIVLGSNSGATPEVLGNGLGVLFKVGDSEDLAYKLRSVCNEKERLKPFKERIRLISEKYNNRCEKTEFIRSIDAALKFEREKNIPSIDLIDLLEKSGFIEKQYINYLRSIVVKARYLYKRLKS